MCDAGSLSLHQAYTLSTTAAAAADAACQLSTNEISSCEVQVI